MATLHNLALSLFRTNDTTKIKKTAQAAGHHPMDAVPLITKRHPTISRSPRSLTPVTFASRFLLS
ncbi:hypothetical protein [Actinomadura roseirufa]|uniref:hypothetical protein n=1 Tax=Actinomadura roseirufa TaxID=2094049 RepID=UPI00104183B0|nr:hypothetical protein [Actinomadura roseirufa]